MSIEEIIVKLLAALATGATFGYWQKSYLAGAFMFSFVISIS
jgi:hypothetical protein